MEAILPLEEAFARHQEKWWMTKKMPAHLLNLSRDAMLTMVADIGKKLKTTTKAKQEIDEAKSSSRQ